MKNDMENKDWLNEFETLKQVNANNPFTVPSGYFGDLTERIISLKNIAASHAGHEGFVVPEDYFSTLSDNIQSRVKVETAAGAHNAGFEVPVNYFDELSANIQSRLTLEGAARNEHAGLEVPEGYFENLHQQVTARVAIEEALNAPAENTFDVPAGYFDRLNEAILEKTVNTETLEVTGQPSQPRGIVRRMFASNIYKYAVAACVTVAIGVTFILNSNKSIAPAEQNASSYLHSRLSDIPVSEIKNYVEQNLDAGETQTTLVSDENINDDEILDYIDTQL
ncbi:hypothetical protein DJ568_01450 [Mucilaginibacter hurinus]|uniref:Uncharacterized protein n=1 Tax=Mucilaginibacter hurinus TaxID=2201324 RepID=A0A367GT00_9SPHI|nr:hypothetical protein [Mucilaginibacter hurinus]RCH56552.1 hypothetical protein DJ568_01450 [Mucilaginibacter hurinus]